MKARNNELLGGLGSCELLGKYRQLAKRREKHPTQIVELVPRKGATGGTRCEIRHLQFVPSINDLLLQRGGLALFALLFGLFPIRNHDLVDDAEAVKTFLLKLLGVFLGTSLLNLDTGLKKISTALIIPTSPTCLALVGRFALGLDARWRQGSKDLIDVYNKNNNNSMSRSRNH